MSYAFQNCAGQIKKLIFTRFIHECRNTEGMLRLGISLESILSREPPAWRKFHRPKIQGGKEKERRTEIGAGEGGTGSETEATASTWISTFWGTKGWQ
jgi:hypothetical protein